MIELTAVKKSYGTLEALKGIDLHVPSGEICGVIGKSGAGKSSLIRCANLLERPDSGHVQIANQRLTQLSSRELRIARRKIGMIFQHFNLLSSRTIFDNIALPLQLAGHDRTFISQRVHSLLELTELKQKHDRYPAQLSGGQKQRVAIARALACQPRVLLCDEATSALDPETTRSILNLLAEINQTLGVTILLITHETDVVKRICDRVVVLDQGCIIEQASNVDFFIKPQTALGKAFVETSLNHALPPEIQKMLLPTPEENAHPVLDRKSVV